MYSSGCYTRLVSAGDCMFQILFGLHFDPGRFEAVSF